MSVASNMVWVSGGSWSGRHTGEIHILRASWLLRVLSFERQPIWCYFLNISRVSTSRSSTRVRPPPLPFVHKSICEPDSITCYVEVDRPAIKPCWFTEIALLSRLVITSQTKDSKSFAIVDQITKLNITSGSIFGSISSKSIMEPREVLCTYSHTSST